MGAVIAWSRFPASGLAGVAGTAPVSLSILFARPGKEKVVTETENLLLGAAERICSETFGESVELAMPEDVRGWDGRTWTRRCRIVAPVPGGPSSVILKQFRLGDGHGMSEWAGLEFIEQLGIDPPVAPRIYGGDVDLSLIVIEDLGDAGSLGLSGILAGSDPTQAGIALVAASAALGQLHAASRHREAEYRELRSRLPAAEHEPFHQSFRTRESWGRFVENLALAGTSPAAGAGVEIEQVAGMLADPGPFRTFTHGDTCLSNIVLVDGAARFFDLEVSGYRHALIDGAFVTLRLLGCQESGRIPMPVLRRMEAGYRRELIAGIPEAGDEERFNADLVAMSTVWLALLLDRLGPSLEKDRKMVTGTNRQRVLYALDAFALLAGERGCFPSLARTARAAHDRLSARWPGNEYRLARFAAFRSAGLDQATG